MTLLSIAINGTNIEDLGLQPLGSLAGWLDAPERSFQATPVLTRAGGVPVLGTVSYAPRTLALGFQRNAGTPTLSRAGLDALYQLLDGLLEITAVDAPGHMLYAHFQKAVGSVFSITFLGSDYQSAGTLISANPFWHDCTPVSTMLPSGIAVPVPYGSKPGNYTVWIGPGTNPALVFYDSRGGILGQMRFTLTLGANDFLRLETREGLKIKKTVSGTESDAYATLNAADCFLPLDPNDGGYIGLVNASGMLCTWRSWST